MTKCELCHEKYWRIVDHNLRHVAGWIPCCARTWRDRHVGGEPTLVKEGKGCRTMCIKIFVSTTAKQRHGEAGDLHGLERSEMSGEEMIWDVLHYQATGWTRARHKGRRVPEGVYRWIQTTVWCSKRVETPYAQHFCTRNCCRSKEKDLRCGLQDRDRKNQEGQWGNPRI